MSKLIDRVKLHVDQSGQLSLPKELQEKLEPGIVLVVETRHNGAIALQVQRVQAPQVINEQASSQPQLINKDGILVVRGEMPPEFDWDTFIDDREAPLHSFEPSRA
ncbi:MAG: hypothetical protein L0287_34615 [Anaerolineae bacterium]|nr:hypothetical protein [Anaerolineae bacterium]